MLDQVGINQLEAIMIANGQYFYNQKLFGITTDCGTELCAAGFARLLKVGKKQFDEEVLAHTERFSIPFVVACEQDGAELLGIDVQVTKDSRLLPIFNSPRDGWPLDLARKYESATEPKDRIAVYINILRTRVNDDGTFIMGDIEDEDMMEDMEDTGE